MTSASSLSSLATVRRSALPFPYARHVFFFVMCFAAAAVAALFCVLALVMFVFLLPFRLLLIRYVWTGKQSFWSCGEFYPADFGTLFWPPWGGVEGESFFCLSLSTRLLSSSFFLVTNRIFLFDFVHSRFWKGVNPNDFGCCCFW